MSTLDDKAKEVSAEAVDEAETESPQKKQDNGPWGYIILFFIIGFAGSLVIGWGIFPEVLYSQKSSR